MTFCECCIEFENFIQNCVHLSFALPFVSTAHTCDVLFSPAQVRCLDQHAGPVVRARAGVGDQVCRPERVAGLQGGPRLVVRLAVGCSWGLSIVKILLWMI